MSQTDLNNPSNNHVSYGGISDSSPKYLHLESKVANDSEEKPQENEGKSNTSCLGRCLDKFKLEIIAFLFMFSNVMTGISSTAMILDKVCLVHFNYSHEICSNLDNYTDIKFAIEKKATNYQLGHTLFQTAPAVLISCFIGPWSDRYGRKVPLLISLAGMCLDTLGSAVYAYYLYSRVEYYFIPAIFTGCFGGVVTVLTVIYSYASDLTTAEGRTMKFGFMEMAVGIPQPLGAAAGGWIYNLWGYPAVFMVSAVGLTVTFILVIAFLPETRGLDNHESLKAKLKNLFIFETFKEGFAATIKKRPNQGRKQIILLIISMCFIVIATKSTGDINYYFVRHEYNWSNEFYSTVIAIYSIIGVVVLVIVVPLLKYFRAGDPTLGFVGTISIFLKYIGIGLAWKPAVFHVASVLGGLQGCAPLAGRSRISKVVSEEDIGKVFSFVATAEALLPVLTTVLISQIFNVFLEIYPGMPYIIVGSGLIVPLGVFMWMTRLPNAKPVGNENHGADRDIDE